MEEPPFLLCICPRSGGVVSFPKTMTYCVIAFFNYLTQGSVLPFYFTSCYSADSSAATFCCKKERKLNSCKICTFPWELLWNVAIEITPTFNKYHIPLQVLHTYSLILPYHQFWIRPGSNEPKY